MVDAKAVKERIIKIIGSRGPSLPISLARETSMNSLFVSAFLSELVDDNQIKVSNLKVGGSPLYFLEGQEQQLEKFYTYLHPKEGEAFLLLKQNKILKESDLDPAIRVALRSIKDFSIGMKLNNEIYWRYILTPEREAIEILQRERFPRTQNRTEDFESFVKKEPEIPQKKFETRLEPLTPQILEKISEKLLPTRNDSSENETSSKVHIVHIKVDPNPEENDSKTLPEKQNLISEEKIKYLENKTNKGIEDKQEDSAEAETINEKPKQKRKAKEKRESVEKVLEQVPTPILSQFQNPLAAAPIVPQKKEKPKSEFVQEVIDFLEKNRFRILEEKEFKAKEYFCIVQFETALGPINFLTLAKDKKSVSEEELKDLLSKAQAIPLPALFLYTGNLSKKALEYESKYYSILKTKKIE